MQPVHETNMSIKGSSLVWPENKALIHARHILCIYITLTINIRV